MKSGKQRKLEIKVARMKRAAKRGTQGIAMPVPPANAVACDPARLAPYNSYGSPRFVFRGYYVDEAFRCRDCGVECVWTAARQKWWYEVAQGNVETRAVRCAPCRVKKRARKSLARRVSMEGLLAKQARRIQ